jgi:hypothetical protein
MGITLDITLYWKTHTDQLLPELSWACNAIRVIIQTTVQEKLVMVYYAYFYLIMNYDIIFGVINPTAPVFLSSKKSSKNNYRF